MQSTKRIVVIAGEESGDAHAAAFIQELKSAYPNIEFSGIGGRHMKQAGVTLISDLAKHGVTGATEVLRHIRVIGRAFKDIKAHLHANKPDLLILVDYPGFNLRLAKYAKQTLGIRVLYYISPQIWAWKASRIKTIRANVDHMAVILPFEKKIYEEASVPVSFVGHPLVDKIKTTQTPDALRHELSLPRNKRIIAMLPGSRINEINKHMPILVKTAELLASQIPDIHFAIPVAGTLDMQTIDNYFANSQVSYSLINGRSVETASCADAVVVASGTASLECALLEKPMCIIYKASLFTATVALKVMNVKYLGLCNLLNNAMTVPELLHYDCNPVELTRTLTELLEDQDTSIRMVKRLTNLKKSLSSISADCSIADLIARELKLNNEHTVCTNNH